MAENILISIDHKR